MSNSFTKFSRPPVLVTSFKQIESCSNFEKYLFKTIYYTWTKFCFKFHLLIHHSIFYIILTNIKTVNVKMSTADSCSFGVKAVVLPTNFGNKLTPPFFVFFLFWKTME